MVVQVKSATICVVGAGYVGLPLAKAFARNYSVISFDIDANKVKSLSEKNGNPNHVFTAEPALIAEADFISVCVPTPLSEGKRPDMSYIREAAAIVGRYMKRGAIVILESSVYPGATEEVFKPVLEQASGYECGKDFGLAYSPERINPGDLEHSVDKVTKIVAAYDEETLESVADLYRRVTPNIFEAKNIRTAEAAKLVENTQRDLNIALMNELSIVFHEMGIDTKAVLDAAATKWNFLRFSPGLVGGYCIPVVPHFLAHKAQEHGYHPQLILAARAVNDSMPGHVAHMAVSSINHAGKMIKGSKVLIMGCTYKENVADIRETPVRKVIKELHKYGVEVYGYDPLVRNGEEDLGIRFFEFLTGVPRMDCIILAVAHDVFKGMSLCELRRILNPYPVIIDVRGALDTPEIRSSEIDYKRL
ncbi:MAG: nucleotide sugar dehydrogenase [Chloroflexi bacterium]|nr:nucleotide sugar dehydrogenase [Chloroflexota bacterium]